MNRSLLAPFLFLAILTGCYTPPRTQPRTQWVAPPSTVDFKIGTSVVEDVTKPYPHTLQVMNPGKASYCYGEQFAYAFIVGSYHAGKQVKVELLDPKRKFFQTLLDTTVPTQREAFFYWHDSITVVEEEPCTVTARLHVGPSTWDRTVQFFPRQKQGPMAIHINRSKRIICFP